MKFPGWITLQLATLTAVALLAFALVTQTNRIRTLQAEKEAAAAALVKGDEAHRLEVAGLKLAHEASQEALERDLEEERQAKGILANALAKALEAAPRAKPIGSATGSTGPVHVDGGASPPSVPVPAGCTVAPSPPTVQPSVCLLSPGDSGEIRVSGVALRTEAGNVALVAQAEAWRVTANSPQTRLFSGELHLDAKYLKPPETIRGSSWGIGAAVAGGRFGWAAGPAIAVPTYDLWRLHLDLSAGVLLGPGGEWVATSTVIGRWR